MECKNDDKAVYWRIECEKLMGYITALQAENERLVDEVTACLDQAHADLDAEFFDEEYTGDRPDLQDSETMVPVYLLERVATALTAQAAEIARLKVQRDDSESRYGRAVDGLCVLTDARDDWRACAEKAEAERDEARAATAAAYERAALEAWYVENSYMARRIRALATEAETTALAEIVKQAVDAETRACAEICEEYSKDHGSGMFDKHSAACANAIRARLDQPKAEGGE